MRIRERPAEIGRWHCWFGHRFKKVFWADPPERLQTKFFAAKLA